MKIITGLRPEDTIDAAALSSEILRERTTAERFRLDCTARQAYVMLLAACQAEVESRRRTFVLTPEMKGHIVEAARWLTSDGPTFGLFLCGRSGNGKSTLLRAVADLAGRFRADFALVNSRDLVRWAKAHAGPGDSEEAWRRSRRYVEAMEIDALAIDDVGTEAAAGMVYGERVAAVTDLLYERYDRRLTTFVSSNLAPGDMAGVYDARVADRLREMMTVVSFGDEPSFRTGEGASC